MKKFVENIIENIVASVIISIFAAVISLINPSLIPYVITIAVIVIAFFTLVKLIMFGTTKFKWNYTYSFEKHSMYLKSINEGTDTQNFGIIKKPKFNGCIEGYYDCDDVFVKKIEFSALDAQWELKTKDNSGNEEIFRSPDDIEIQNNPVSANYDISFNNNKPVDVYLKATFNYDKISMSPEYYFEVYRPTQKLVMELYVQKDVSLHNVKKIVEAEHGDILISTEKELKGKVSASDPLVTIYRFTVRNPKLLHKYKITWEWRRI